MLAVLHKELFHCYADLYFSHPEKGVALAEEVTALPNIHLILDGSRVLTIEIGDLHFSERQQRALLDTHTLFMELYDNGVLTSLRIVFPAEAGPADTIALVPEHVKWEISWEDDGPQMFAYPLP